jgi:subtilisin family serine protease
MMRAAARLLMLLLAFWVVAPPLASGVEALPLRVVVALDLPALPEPWLPSAQVQEQRAAIFWTQYLLALDLEGTDFEITQLYGSVPFMGLKVSSEALMRLAYSPYVREIGGDNPLAPSLDTSTALIEADQVWPQGLEGSGWTVAVLDTGVDSAHPHLQGKLVKEACFSANASCPNQEARQFGSGAAVNCDYTSGCSHGTHVAGIAVGSSDDLRGVAPAANLIAIQVFSRFYDSPYCPSGQSCPMAYTSDMIRALEYVYQLRDQFQIASVNMSLGGGYYSSRASCDRDNPGVKAAIDNLRAVGIATVVAAGNDGLADGLSAPACISSAISVGATTKSNQVPYWSNTANFLSLLAPGSGIASSVPGGGYASMSGTSMATPHVAGAWALLKQQDPQASVGTVLTRITDTGLSITDPAVAITKQLPQLAQAAEYARVQLESPLITVATLNGPRLRRIPPDKRIRIAWTTSEEISSVDIQLSLDGGVSWTPIATGVQGSSYVWQVPRLESSQRRCRIQVIGRDAQGQVVASDRNDRRFKIKRWRG